MTNDSGSPTPPVHELSPGAERGDGRGASRAGGASKSATRRWVGPAVASGLAMVAAAIAGLVLTGMQDNAIYSKQVDQLLAEKAKFTGRPVRAEGILAHGTLVKRDQPCEYRVTIAKNGPELPVRSDQNAGPDTFVDVPDIDVGVTVEGELQAD